ncbi:hypothetical protein SCP_0302710 [Sparassis crispa]|uniref:Uncharacterized protein n=1 Tax=Sparassis crispa TaxID=139825 RepID=A0A401GEE8_9APHY|nr:hypothetical protein SCP_0302710 [Sparassis crispa]GBE80556.1 hypothetical protein SCP_0302710 [Sparassis crispa]
MDSGTLARHQVEFDLLTGKQKKLVACSTLEAAKSLFEIRKHKNKSKRLTHKITISSQEARSAYLWLERASPLNETQSDSEEQSEGSHYEYHEGLDSSEDAQSDIPAIHDVSNETTGMEHEEALITGARNESQELHADTALRLNPFRDDDTLGSIPSMVGQCCTRSRRKFCSRYNSVFVFF